MWPDKKSRMTRAKVRKSAERTFFKFLIIVSGMLGQVIFSQCATTQTYNVAVFEFFDLEGRQANMSPTFVTYLTEKVGGILNLPVSFQVIEFDEENFSILLSSIHERKIDFLLADSQTVACSEVLFGSAPLVVPRSTLLGANIDAFGAVLVARNGSRWASSPHLDGAVLSLPTSRWLRNFLPPRAWRPLLRGPSRLLHRAGPDPAKAVVADVMAGAADVALLPTGALELIEASGLVSSGILTPLPAPAQAKDAATRASRAHPARVLAALPWADGAVQAAVVAVLLRLRAGHPAAVAGGYSAWLPAPSLQDLRWHFADDAAL